MKLSLVVPCFNEESSAPLFYKAVQQDFSGCGFDYEIVFVNDGSRDRTLDVLKMLTKGPVPVTVVSFSRNFGKEAAMLAGLREAKGDYVTVIDADLQQKPSIALDMVRMLEEDSSLDCVAAYQDGRRESKVLSSFKGAFYSLINHFSDTEFVSGASDFRTFRRQMVDEITALPEYQRFSKGIFSWVGFNVKYIPYTVEERAAGSTSWSFRKLFRYAMDGIISFTSAPLKIPYLLGILSAIVAVIYFIVSLVHRIAVKPEYTIAIDFAVIVMLILGSAVLISIGLLGEYLSRTFAQVKGRPVYIVKEKISNNR